MAAQAPPGAVMISGGGMSLVSVTRLKLRSVRFLPGFLLFSVLSMRQAKRAPGFLGGQLALEPGLGFWTLTMWRDEQAMKAFRDGGAHRHAMPRLLGWCSEASYAHWAQETPQLPALDEARARLVAAPRFSKVYHPAPDHAARRVAPAAAALRPGPALRPRVQETRGGTEIGR